MTATCYVILGTPRSGTSAVAGVLHHLGVFMGEHFPTPTRENPNPSFEDIEVTAVHSVFIGQSEGSISPVLSDDAEKLAAYERLIRKRESLGVPWGFKCRWTPFLFHVTKSLVSCPLSVIVTQRPVHASVHSWTDMRRRRLPQAKMDIMDSLYAIDLSLEDWHGPLLRVPYHDLLAYPRAQVGRIAEFIGMAVIEAAVAFIDPSLRRY